MPSPATGTLPILDLPPPGYVYNFHITLVRGEAKTIVVIEPEPSLLNQLLDDLGASDGLLSVIVGVLLFWSRIKNLASSLGKRDDGTNGNS